MAAIDARHFFSFKGESASISDGKGQSGGGQCPWQKRPL